MSTPSVLDTALSCIRNGISIVPIDPSTKKPKSAWKLYQSEIADENTVRRWADDGLEAIAVIGGRVSGGLLIIDFDVPTFTTQFAAEVGELANGLPIQQTGGGGHQILLRCPDPGGNQKLAWAPDDSEDTGRTVAIETRGEGGYAVIAPSLHPSGNRYKWLGGGVEAIPTVAQAHADALLAAARKLDQVPLTRQDQEKREALARAEQVKRHAARNGDSSIIDLFNRANTIESVLEKYGYLKGPKGRYIRPNGESESVSVKDGRSFHWSSNDPLNDNHAHDAFDVMSHFECGGDIKKAVRGVAGVLGMSYDDEPRTAFQRNSGKAQERKPAEPWPDPRPLPSGLPAVAPFDPRLLPAAFRPWITDIADRMQCPPDYIATTAMIAVATLLGRKVGIRPKCHDDWQVVANLWGLNVGRPSVLKSPAMKEALKPLTTLEIDAKEDYADALRQFEAGKLLADAQKKDKAEQLKKAVKAGTNAQAIANELAGLGEDKLPPVRKRYMTSNTTVEKLGELLRDNPDGVLIYSDELIGFLKSMDREGHESDRGFYLTAWDGDKRYTYDRIGRGTIDIEAACVSIVGSIQPGVLHDYLRGAVAGGSGDDGLIQRFQLAVWPDPMPTWRNVDRYPNSIAKQCAYKAFQHLVALTHDQVGALDDEGKAEVPYLRFDVQAQAIFDFWRADLESRLRSSEGHPALEAHLAKYRSLIPSLALVIHLVDDGYGPVTADALERALLWADYLESHAKRLFASVIDGPSVAARELGRRIRKGDLGHEFAARDVYRRGWTGLDRESTAAAIDVLITMNWVEERIKQTAGRDKVSYLINPKLAIASGEELTEPTEAPSVTFVSTQAGANVEIEEVAL